jgi:sulfide dehydrogenase [flavocytochrome c] flavoprotein subunit
MNTATFTDCRPPAAACCAGAALGGLALAGCASTPSGPSIGRVVVVGGGFGGATAARYLRLWGGNVDVTLVERNASSSPARSPTWWSAATKQMADITRGYDGLKADGRQGGAGRGDAIDAAARRCGWPAAASWPTTA